MKLVSVCAALAIVALSAPAASAHHSFAMFDETREVTLEGTVKEFQWANPHTWVQVMVTDPKTGKGVEWGIEGSPTTSLKRKGWTRTSLVSGDKVKVVIHPLKNGAAGGSLSTIYKDGQVVGGASQP